jgi:hypothetical protein
VQLTGLGTGCDIDRHSPLRPPLLSCCHAIPAVPLPPAPRRFAIKMPRPLGIGVAAGEHGN